MCPRCLSSSKQSKQKIACGSVEHVSHFTPNSLRVLPHTDLGRFWDNYYSNFICPFSILYTSLSNYFIILAIVIFPLLNSFINNITSSCIDIFGWSGRIDLLLFQLLIISYNKNNNSNQHIIRNNQISFYLHCRAQFFYIFGTNILNSNQRVLNFITFHHLFFKEIQIFNANIY